MPIMPCSCKNIFKKLRSYVFLSVQGHHNLFITYGDGKVESNDPHDIDNVVDIAEE